MFDRQPHLQNDLVRLRPLTQDDFDDLYSVASDPLIWEQHPKSDRYTRPVFKQFFKDAIDSGGALIAIDNNNGKVIGSSRYQVLEGVNDGVEIGWSFLAREYWGGKYNRAMKKLMIEHALKSLEAVVFIVDSTNMRSRKAMEKIGGHLLVEPEFIHMLNRDPAKVTYVISRRSYVAL